MVVASTPNSRASSPVVNPFGCCANIRSICSIRSIRLSGLFICKLPVSVEHSLTYDPCKIRGFWEQFSGNWKKVCKKVPFCRDVIDRVRGAVKWGAFRTHEKIPAQFLAPQSRTPPHKG